MVAVREFVERPTVYRAVQIPDPAEFESVEEFRKAWADVRVAIGQQFVGVDLESGAALVVCPRPYSHHMRVMPGEWLIEKPETLGSQWHSITDGQLHRAYRSAIEEEVTSNA